jgi:hypothetical protein
MKVPLNCRVNLTAQQLCCWVPSSLRLSAAGYVGPLKLLIELNSPTNESLKPTEASIQPNYTYQVARGRVFTFDIQGDSPGWGFDNRQG